MTTASRRPQTRAQYLVVSVRNQTHLLLYLTIVRNPNDNFKKSFQKPIKCGQKIVLDMALVVAQHPQIKIIPQNKDKTMLGLSIFVFVFERALAVFVSVHTNM